MVMVWVYNEGEARPKKGRQKRRILEVLKEEKQVERYHELRRKARGSIWVVECHGLYSFQDMDKEDILQEVLLENPGYLTEDTYDERFFRRSIKCKAYECIRAHSYRTRAIETLGSMPRAGVAGGLSQEDRTIDKLEDRMFLEQILSGRVYDVAMLLLEGYTQFEIADKLNVARATVQRDIDRIRSAAVAGLVG